MSHNITIEGGTSLRLPTAGKYCDRDIVITATGAAAEPVIQPLKVTENGTYTAPYGVDGHSPVTVNVPIPDGYIQPSGELELTENGTHDVTAYASVNVNVPTGGSDDSSLLDAILDGSVEEIESNVTKIGERALNYRSKLVKVSLPNVTSIGAYAFYGSFRTTALPTLFLPNLTTAGENAFSESGVNIANLPKLNVVSNQMFYYSLGLVSIDLGVATQIKGMAFANCSKLTIVIIRTNSVCSLAYATDFNSTPIKKGTGYIYVPAALVDSYKTATNWSTYADQFRAIEDYPDICGEVSA